MLHVNMIEDKRGDLVDIAYYCSQRCADAAGIPQPSAWPGGMETDYDQYCAQCGDHIAHGLQCEMYYDATDNALT
jgi:hypothetical protein